MTTGLRSSIAPRSSGGLPCGHVPVRGLRESIKSPDRVPLVLRGEVRVPEDHGIGLVAEDRPDGIEWHPIPRGITVTGSRYALVLDEIREGDLDVQMNEYVVGVGRSRGKLAPDYLRGHVDKGCFEKLPDGQVAGAGSESKHISYVARLKEPFAVLLRGDG